MYQQGIASSALGSLLRKVQEDRENMPHTVPQNAQDESPIRAQAQGPLTVPESTGSAKVVALKPEMAGSMEQNPLSVVAPQTPVPPMASVSPVSAPSGNPMSTPSVASTPATSSMTGRPPSTPSRGLGLGSVINPSSFSNLSMGGSSSGKVAGAATSVSKPTVSVGSDFKPTGTISAPKPSRVTSSLALSTGPVIPKALSSAALLPALIAGGVTKMLGSQRINPQEFGGPTYSDVAGDVKRSLQNKVSSLFKRK